MAADDANVVRIANQLEEWKATGTRFFATSSFQSGSGVLLHLLHRFSPGAMVVFLNTGFHFVETLLHRRRLGRMFDLRIVDVFSPVSRLEQQSGGRPLFAVDPDRCCHLNKVLPLEPFLASHDVWISGLRSAQTELRESLDEFRVGHRGCRCWHPLLGWSDESIGQYLSLHAIPRHPLDSTGMRSIGCQPCTRLSGPSGRAGRWAGLKKTECGLHLPQVT